MKLRVGTRKGLFTFEHSAAGSWSVTQTDFLGDPVTMVLKDARNGDLFAALNLGHFGCKLHRQEDHGSSWQEVAVPKYPKEEDPEQKGASLKLIWELAASESVADAPLWAGTIPGGLFRSIDRGESWELVESLWQRPEREQWFGGGYDEPGIHSICVHPQNPNDVVIGISCGGVWRTTDGGRTWEQIGQGLRAEYMPPERAFDLSIQDPHRIVQCHARPDHLWTQHHNGIFRSLDRGLTWREFKEVSPSTFGFSVVVDRNNPQKAWFVPAQNDGCRIPVNGALTVTRTEDGGESFAAIRAGLPQGSAYDLVYRHALDLHADGQVLAFGSTTGGLWLSEDGGAHWQLVHGHLPPINVVRFDPQHG